MNSWEARSHFSIENASGQLVGLAEREVIERTAKGISRSQSMSETYAQAMSFSAILHVYNRLKQVHGIHFGVPSAIKFMACATAYMIFDNEWGIPFVSSNAVSFMSGEKIETNIINSFVSIGWMEEIEDPKNVKKRIRKTIGKGWKANMFVVSAMRGNLYAVTKPGVSVMKDIIGYQMEYMDTAAYISGLVDR